MLRRLIATGRLICRRPPVVGRFGREQRHRGKNDCSFSGMLEVDGGAAADHRLDLADAPIRLIRMPYEISGNETLGHAGGSFKVGPASGAKYE